MVEIVSFTSMDQASRADYDLVFAHDEENVSQQADRVLGWLQLMSGKSPYAVSRLEHSLQSATRAEHDGASEEMVVCTLLHDIGDVMAPANHSQVAAALLRPYVSQENCWIVEHHGLFQGYYWFHHFERDRNTRDKYKDHEFYEPCVEFCARWDQCSFDPHFKSEPLDHFEPLVRELFAKKPSEFI